MNPRYACFTSLVLVAGFLLYDRQVAAACDCAVGEPSAAEAVARATVVFEGRVRSVGEASTADEDLVSFELDVLRSWVGPAAGGSVTIWSSLPNCGFQLVAGDRALIYAWPGHTGRLYIGQCGNGRVRIGSPPAEDQKVLGPPRSELTAAASAGCGCETPRLSAKERRAKANLVFRGRVLRQWRTWQTATTSTWIADGRARNASSE